MVNRKNLWKNLAIVPGLLLIGTSSAFAQTNTCNLAPTPGEFPTGGTFEWKDDGTFRGWEQVVDTEEYFTFINTTGFTLSSDLRVYDGIVDENVSPSISGKIEYTFSGGPFAGFGAAGLTPPEYDLGNSNTITLAELGIGNPGSGQSENFNLKIYHDSIKIPVTDTSYTPPRDKTLRMTWTVACLD